MIVFRKVSEFLSHINSSELEGRTIGFVPTMGAIHEGHIALIYHAIAENDEVVVSIFINPTQFNNPDHLLRYPRNEEEDILKLKSVSCSIVFIPEVREIYPNDISRENFDLGELETVMEGLYKSGHFQGVATVVRRLFDIVNPNRAYFGEKDYQQLLVVERIARKRKSEVKIIRHEIERDENGLAFSSRNELLSEKEKQEAVIIYRNMLWAKAQAKNISPSEIKKAIQNKLKSSSLNLEYVEIASPENLTPIKHWNEAEHARIFIAAYCREIRLIDNLSLF